MILKVRLVALKKRETTKETVNIGEMGKKPVICRIALTLFRNY